MSLDVSLNADNGSTDGRNKPQPLTGTLSGTGVGPLLSTSIAPDSTIDFGKALPLESILRSVGVTNATGDPELGVLTDLTVVSASITGPGAAMFSLVDFTPGSVLAKSASADLKLQFTPAAGALGSQTAMLTLITDEGVPLGGSGTSVSFSLAAEAIPEPSTMILLLTGLVGLVTFWIGRKRGGK